MVHRFLWLTTRFLFCGSFFVLTPFADADTPCPPPQCECPGGSWYDANRGSCVKTACESVPGMPDGDKGGGYFAWQGHLFVDVPGADCPPPLTIEAKPNLEVGCDRHGAVAATVEIEINGGVGPFTCAGPAHNLPMLVEGSSCLAQGVTVGKSLTFTVIDARGQVATTTVKVDDVLTLAPGTVEAPSCCSCTDGRATVEVQGEGGPFRYRWSDDQNTKTATGLAPGTHSVTVTDQNGCYRSLDVVVPQPGDCEVPFNIDINSSTRVDCDRMSGERAEVEIVIEGGTGPFTCLGPGDAFPQKTDGSPCTAVIAPSNQSLTFEVIDAQGQRATKRVTISSGLDLVPGAVRAPSCCSCEDGSASVDISGDHGPYYVRWQDYQKTTTATGLASGKHKVTVSDQRGCFESIEITVPKARGCVDGGGGDGRQWPRAELWDLGTLNIGRAYETTVTAKNISCKGKHDFEIRVEEAPWFRVAGPTVLRKIKIGRQLTSAAVVDLSDAQPGIYRGLLRVSCLTCPARCEQSESQFEVVVKAE